MVNEGIPLDASMVPKESSDDITLSTEQHDGSTSSRYDAYVERAQANRAVSDVENAVVRPSYDNDTLTEVRKNMMMWIMSKNVPYLLP
ncbi:hypothetical protein Tco_0569110 [Tanacetum coccineum]